MRGTEAAYVPTSVLKNLVATPLATLSAFLLRVFIPPPPLFLSSRGTVPSLHRVADRAPSSYGGYLALIVGVSS